MIIRTAAMSSAAARQVGHDRLLGAVGVLLLGLAVLSSIASAAADTLVAERITPANAGRWVQGGLDAAGGIGDWALGNGTLCAVVSGVEHESDLSAQGGVLIDLGFCDRNDDQFVATQDLRDGSLATPMDLHSVTASLGRRRASLLSLGGIGGLREEIRYSVDLDEPQRLRVHKRISRRSGADPELRLLTPVLFNYDSMETFLFDSRAPERSVGFEQVGFSSQGVSAFAEAARRNDTMIAVSGPRSPVPIAYGWRLVGARKHYADGATQVLPVLAAADAGASVFMVLTDPFWVGGDGAPGLTQLLQIALMGLEPGEIIEIEEEFWIGRRGEVAAITDQLLPAAPIRSGRLVDPQTERVTAAVAVQRQDAAAGYVPFTAVRPDPDGRFQFRAPAGDYRLIARAAGGRETTVAVHLDAGTSRLEPLTLPSAAVLELPRGEPMRLVIRGRDGTADPDLQNTLTGFSVRVDGQRVYPEPVPMVFLAGIDSDRRALNLPPGRYRVIATRGIEYTLSQVDIELAPGQRRLLEIPAPVRAVTTPGFIAADLHVHSGPSMDNAFPVRERVRTFVAEHGEVMVATEHETLFDFQPLLQEMAVADRIVAVTGTEMTGQVPTARLPHTVGHANFFPLTVQPQVFRRGVPANEGRRLREVLYAMRERNPAVFSQLNHARADDGFLREPAEGDVSERIDNGAYLDHLGPAAYPYDPRLPLTAWPNRVFAEADPTTGLRDLDVDALEILNGKRDTAPGRRQALLADWYSLLLQGVRLSGTANSDSHGKHQQVALPRNMVAVTDDSIAAFDEAAFVDALRAGRSYGTTGPLLTLTLDGVGLGGTLVGRRAELKATVQHADWVDAQALRVVVNGEPIQTVDLSNRKNGRFAMDLEFPVDSFVLIEVEGRAQGAYAAVYPGHLPYAFTNPIYVDADGDGRWTPPGLRRRR